MTAISADVSSLLHGPLRESSEWPLALRVRLGSLRPGFLPKGQAGRGYRAVARNGRVLLASDRPLQELTARPADVRLQTWHKRILPAGTLQPWGILLYVRIGAGPDRVPIFDGSLACKGDGIWELAVEVGARLVLGFRLIHPVREA